MTFIKQLKRPRREKIVLGILMAMGLVASVASAMRLVVTSFYVSDSDPLYDIVIPAIWGSVEEYVCKCGLHSQKTSKISYLNTYFNLRHLRSIYTLPAHTLGEGIEQARYADKYTPFAHRGQCLRSTTVPRDARISAEVVELWRC